MSNLKKFGAGVAGLTLSGAASAQNTTAIDLTDAISQINIGTTAMASVGLAVIGAAALSFGLRWVKATFF